MSTTTHVVNITRKDVRIGTTNIPGIMGQTKGAIAVTAIDLDALGSNGRHDLMAKLASGSLLPAGSATSVKVTSISLDSRGRNRIGSTNLPDLTLVTINPTTLGTFGWQDLQRLLASGQLLVGDTAGSANLNIANLSSKALRFGTLAVAPKRIAGGYTAGDVITLSPTPAAGAGYLIAYNGTNIGSPTEYIQGSNLTAAAIQSDLRTASGDVGAVVTGTDDTGPFTVAWSPGFNPASALVVTASVSDVITLTSFDNGDVVKVTYNAVESGSITKGTNSTSGGVQTVIRALGGTAALVRVAGADGGPYSVEWPAGVTPLSVLTITSGTGGAAGTVVRTPMVGTDVQTAGDPAGFTVSDVTALTVAQRRDLQWLLAAGQIIPIV